ncbi:AAA family ATPase [Mycobacteroides abscessus]|uniref:AAA family ATPase n=1 Tax=Mycobacteroides abscessus TaxID=36809 RepID=UPI0009C6DCA4|nr:AAA family ATPase [Mycobacteroides abscessus]SLC37719.1 type VII secretion protein EccCb [Mycobacteroides abscessus subsp. massiliense]
MESQLIVGIPGTGKTRHPQAIAQEAVASGASVTVVTHRPGEWDGLGHDIRVTSDISAITSLPAHLRRNAAHEVKTQPMLLVIDQLDRMMDEDDAVADAVDALVRQGRSSGVSVLVTAQDARRVPHRVVDNVGSVTVTGYRNVINARDLMWLGLDPDEIAAAVANSAAVVVTKRGEILAA